MKHQLANASASAKARSWSRAQHLGQHQALGMEQQGLGLGGQHLPGGVADRAGMGLGLQHGVAAAMRWRTEAEQPIKFNHTLHAGKWPSTARYCHSGAEKSVRRHPQRQCVHELPQGHQQRHHHRHHGDGQDLPRGGLGPATRARTSEKRIPIKWVKVHVLPDHVAFSHATQRAWRWPKWNARSAMVRWIPRMDVAEQWSPLTMGWCISATTRPKCRRWRPGAAQRILRGDPPPPDPDGPGPQGAAEGTSRTEDHRA